MTYQISKDTRCPECRKFYTFFVKIPTFQQSSNYAFEFKPFSMDFHIKCSQCGAEWNITANLRQV